MKENMKQPPTITLKVNEKNHLNSMKPALAEYLEKYLQWAEKNGELVTLSGFPF
jgi:hypothetical protein